MLNRPFDLYQGGITDQYLSGFMNQVSQAVDDAMTEEVKFYRDDRGDAAHDIY